MLTCRTAAAVVKLGLLACSCGYVNRLKRPVSAVFGDLYKNRSCRKWGRSLPGREYSAVQ